MTSVVRALGMGQLAGVKGDGAETHSHLQAALRDSDTTGMGASRALHLFGALACDSGEALHFHSDSLTGRERGDVGQANPFPSVSKRISMLWLQPFRKDHFDAPYFWSLGY